MQHEHFVSKRCRKKVQISFTVSFLDVIKNFNSKISTIHANSLNYRAICPINRQLAKVYLKTHYPQVSFWQLIEAEGEIVVCQKTAGKSKYSHASSLSGAV